VTDLADLLRKMGAKISGDGTERITIEVSLNFTVPPIRSFRTGSSGDLHGGRGDDPGNIELEGVNLPT